jgi:hypothetical protein
MSGIWSRCDLCETAASEERLGPATRLHHFHDASGPILRGLHPTSELWAVPSFRRGATGLPRPRNCTDVPYLSARLHETDFLTTGFLIRSCRRRAEGRPKRPPIRPWRATLNSRNVRSHGISRGSARRAEVRLQPFRRPWPSVSGRQLISGPRRLERQMYRNYKLPCRPRCIRQYQDP